MAYEEIEIIEEADGKRKTTKKTHGVKETAKAGISFGTALAMVISYYKWQSIGWAIVHRLFSWAYVIYYYFKYC